MENKEVRESKESNDIFFVCSLIEYIARITKNTRKYIVNALGYKAVKKIYELADIYHCENIDKVTDEFIEKYNIKQGEFDNVAECKYSVPDFWDIGRVYNNLITDIVTAGSNDYDIIDILFEVYNSWITKYIDNYNSSMYYENPGYIYESYKNGSLLKE